MKPITIAKNIWNHANDLQKQIDNGIVKRQSVMYHYFGILSMYGAVQAAHYSDDKEWLKEVNDMLDKYPYEFETSKFYFKYNFSNYRVGGLAKAWACMKGYFGDDHKEQVRKYAEETLVAPMSHDGILCNPYCPEKELIWIDIVYAVAPYMLYAGIMFNEERYIDFAIDQTIKLYDVFIDKSNGLLHQGRGFMGDKTTISEDYWGRGNGWGYIGLTELIRYLPKDHKRYNEVLERYVSLSEALIKYQDHRGLWRQIINEPYSWEESSGSALFLYGFGVGIRLGILDKNVYMPVFEKGLEGIMKHCIGDDFSVDRCCHGCLCPGDTPERRGKIEPYLVDVRPVVDDGHSFGPVILAMLEAHRNGIDNLIWK